VFSWKIEGDLLTTKGMSRSESDAQEEDVCEKGVLEKAGGKGRQKKKGKTVAVKGGKKQSPRGGARKIHDKRGTNTYIAA